MPQLLMLTKEQEDMLKTGTCLGGRWYYIPFWFEKMEEEGIYKIHHFENLPEPLKKEINDNRNIR